MGAVKRAGRGLYGFCFGCLLPFFPFLHGNADDGIFVLAVVLRRAWIAMNGFDSLHIIPVLAAISHRPDNILRLWRPSAPFSGIPPHVSCVTL
jgi:hypothetical protein